ncbi:hypothetical protein CDL15_Pgr006646 [Punica granatum]|uniref:Uncharacterized protein n=1 Tax=Punica granatum TaxID=22663 RepID=A0A218X7G9_PUNGR|nr:hypothetical protein CDL15_Pgr006646 [Punica granatum]
MDPADVLLMGKVKRPMNFHREMRTTSRQAYTSLITINGHRLCVFFHLHMFLISLIYISKSIIAA